MNLAGLSVALGLVALAAASWPYGIVLLVLLGFVWCKS